MPPTAEILTIGTELLLGEILDTNARYLAQALRELGIDLYRITTVGDNEERIAQALQEALERAQVVITTGGLGPTVDDPTRAAVARAFAVEQEFHPELWDQIRERFARYGRTPTENNRRQAFLPAGALALENPIGTAPAFIIEREDQSAICLPGVPAEMTALMESAVIPYLRRRYRLQRVIRRRVLHTAGAGESLLDERIQDLERGSNPTIGLSAHPGQVDIRITASGTSAQEVEEALQRMETILRQRLGDLIYGVDQETLEQVVGRLLAERGWRMVSAESGTGGRAAAALAPLAEVYCAGVVLPDGASIERVRDGMGGLLADHGAQVGLALSVIPGTARLRCAYAIHYPYGMLERQAPYGGAPANAARWALNLALNRLRRALQKAADETGTE